MKSPVCNEDCFNCVFDDCKWDGKGDRHGYYMRHTEECKARAKQWQTDNRERVNELSRIKYHKNLDKERERSKQYQKEHSMERAIYMREYRAKQKLKKEVVNG